MKFEQIVWTRGAGWKILVSEKSLQPQLVFVFGSNEALRDSAAPDYFKARFPGAHLFGGTSAYEINQNGFAENSVVATAAEFDNPELQFAKAPLTQASSEEAARVLAAQFSGRENISHIIVLCDGLHINGARFAGELGRQLPGIAVTGGMTASADVAESTVELLDGELLERHAIAVAFGKNVKTGYGSGGGWDAFGVYRKITRSEENCVYEIDGEPALALYRKYLGGQPDRLEYSVQYFPLLLKETAESGGRVRSVIRIDESKNALIFAADMPEGWHVRLMKYNPGRLAEGAAGAAGKGVAGINMNRNFLALLVSCVGRQVVMKKRIEDEIDAAVRVLGGNQIMFGFYSRGEICPLERAGGPVYHNQTMTITTLSDE
ncbi:MAG: FIST N-terminal domain-containing protein [Elusimicrobiaceae bacterium]|nr:FIST N-terminal domain-containing protein [Elusimicrobiaceae bacterium]